MWTVHGEQGTEEPKQPPHPVWEHSTNAFNAATTKLSVLSVQCLLMSGTGKPQQALRLSSTQGWRAASLEGAMPAVLGQCPEHAEVFM